MKAVLDGIAHIGTAWQADLLFDVHTQNDASSSHLHTQHLVSSSVVCDLSNVKNQILSLRPVHVSINQHTKCKNTASKQFEMIVRCFRRAFDIHAYNNIARVRPDFYFPVYYIPQWDRTGMCVIEGTNSDIFFVAAAKNALSFAKYPFGPPQCDGGTMLDFVHPMLKQSMHSCSVHVEGGLVRTDRLLRIPSTVNDSHLIAHMSEIGNDFRCSQPFQVFSDGRLNHNSSQPFQVFSDGHLNPNTVDPEMVILR